MTRDKIKAQYALMESIWRNRDWKKAHTMFPSLFKAVYIETKKDFDYIDGWFYMGNIINRVDEFSGQYIKLDDLLNAVGEKRRFPDFDQIVCWRNVLRINPNHKNAWLKLARLYINNDLDLTEAATCFKEVLRIEPTNIEALCKLGGIQHYFLCLKKEEEEVSLEEKNKAMHPYLRSIEVHPEKAAYYEAYYWLGEMEEQFGDKNKAIDYYQQQVNYTNDAYCKKRIKELSKDN